MVATVADVVQEGGMTGGKWGRFALVFLCFFAMGVFAALGNGRTLATGIAAGLFVLGAWLYPA